MGITWRAQCCQEIFLWSIRRAISALLCDRLDRLGISNMSVTIRDVANAAEVSTATVSNVLNKTGKVGRDTRRLVLSTVKRLGYIRDVHARHLASRDRRTLGIIVSDIENAITGLPHVGSPTAAEFLWAVAVGVMAVPLGSGIRWLGMFLRPHVERRMVLVMPVVCLTVAGLAVASRAPPRKASSEVLFSGQSALGPFVAHSAGY